ncbi:MAG: DUF2933 domain-containing protein [Burkholderiales bacterium]
MNHDHQESPPAFWRSPTGIALCVIAAVAGFFLLAEHRAHLAGILPYALLALCPLMHLFMHRGHGHDDRGHPRQPPRAPQDKESAP